MDKEIEKELDDIDKQCIRINNVLVTPLQNNMTTEKELALKAELKFLYKRKEKIYNKLLEEL